MAFSHVWEGALRPRLHATSWGTWPLWPPSSWKSPQHLQAEAQHGTVFGPDCPPVEPASIISPDLFPAWSPRQWLRYLTLTESVCLHSLSEEKQHVDEASLKREFHSLWASWSTDWESLPALGHSPTCGLEVVLLLTSQPWDLRWCCQ